MGLGGILILIFHNLIFITPGADASLPVKLLSALWTPGVFPYGESKLFFVGYPPIPWLGIMLLGFGARHYFTLGEYKQRVIFFKSGLIALSLFVILRTVNIYGDPAKWAAQKTPLFTILSFINVTKYPPSLLFCLLFLGIMLLIISLAEGVRNKWTDFVCVYGKVPMFYFLVH